MKPTVISPEKLIFPAEDVALRPQPKETDKDWPVFLEFEADIAQRGLLNPFSVRKEGENYVVVDGTRRATAVKRLFENQGLFKDGIVVSIRDEDEYQAMASQIAGNYQTKKTLSTHEIKALKKLAIHTGKGVADVAKLVGMNVPYVEKLLKLTQLPDSAKKLIDSKKITLTNAITLNSLPEGIMEDYLESAVSLTGEEFTALVSERLNEERKLKASGKKEAEFEAKPKLKGKDDLLMLLEQAKIAYEKKQNDYNKGVLDAMLVAFELDEKTIADKKAAYDQRKAEAAEKAEKRKADRATMKLEDAKKMLEAAGMKIS